MRVFPLLKEVFLHRPKGVVQTGIGALVYEVGSENRKEELLDLIKALHGERYLESGLVIDLSDVGLISPSVASAIAGASAEVIRLYKVPVIVANVAPEVLKSLADCRYIHENPIPPILALDRNSDPTYIGAMPDRWRMLLKNLPSDGASASDLAGPSAPNKREVNRFSVYLQELYLNGLARREKVSGSEREGVERGWTYIYYPIGRPRPATQTDDHALDAPVEVARA